ncbi:CopD family protein [Ruegeria marina]|uniref:Putative copper resistance protein D n=1 Tax=Ruegeria marina TaxID=639004 RepID=A0A1G6YBL5_9RHOB|nr:CopD family protein [Ruegeria marina]SDD86986.1 putative copper resistance protein D [Ruegeria marina]
MIAALASADAVTWISILVKTLAYTATLVAAGSVMVMIWLRELTEDARGALRRIAVIGALAAAVLSVLRLPVRASFLMGGSIDGAFDPMMLGIVVDSPLGTSVAVRLIGLALILTILLPVRGARWIALAGALMTCTSFALRGHALGDPRLLLGALVTVHLAGLAFWLGAFAPLSRATRRESPAKAGALAYEFGTKAFWVVAALVAAGAVTLVLLVSATLEALSAPYGQAFLIKLALFVGVLGLAALNKVRLTPDLQAAVPGAAQRLRRSIAVESALVLAILATTAALTTVTSPPSEQTKSASPKPTSVQSAAHVTGKFQWRS